jgi:hypothetical protein
MAISCGVWGKSISLLLRYGEGNGREHGRMKGRR